jgi:hypothetical protein
MENTLHTLSFFCFVYCNMYIIIYKVFLCINIYGSINYSKEQRQHVPCRWVKEPKNLLEMTFITLSANVTA